MKAKHVTMGQVARLEEAWKINPQATLDTLAQPSADEEPQAVVLKYVKRHAAFMVAAVSVAGCACRAGPTGCEASDALQLAGMMMRTHTRTSSDHSSRWRLTTIVR